MRSKHLRTTRGMVLVAASLFWGATFTQSLAATPEQVAQRVDRLIAEELFEPQTQLAPPTDDATFARRVWLDTVGDIPTPERLTAFLLDPAADKRAKLVRDRLDQPQYGQNWARYWRDVIFSRKIEFRALVGARPMVVWLTDQLNDNIGWDQIASQFITAKGDIFDNAAGAIILAQDGRTEETAAEMSRIFLGIQIQCAQCHDHPWDQWEREQFHEFAAFFPRTGARQVQTATRRSYQVVVNDRPEPRKFKRRGNDNRRGVAEHYMSDLEAPEKPGARTPPRFFLNDGELPFGTRDAVRRGELANWMTDTEWFAKAIVNRLWSELVGEGFFEPVDDMGPDRTATAADALDYLAAQFAENGYDLKWLMQTICATEAYGRQIRPRRTPAGTPMAANVAQRLRGDQLFSAILTALGIDELQSGPLANRIAGLNYGNQPTPRTIFNVAFGYDPSVARHTVNASIPQALAMMNTPKINQAVMPGRRKMLGKMLQKISDDELVVDELYLRCLTRLPTDEERSIALAYRDKVDNRGEAFSDLLWSLLNSAEFTHRR